MRQKAEMKLGDWKTTSSSLAAHPGKFVLRLGAGIHEGLGDDGQRGIYHFRHMNVKDEVRVFQNVHPEP